MYSACRVWMLMALAKTCGGAEVAENTATQGRKRGCSPSLLSLYSRRLSACTGSESFFPIEQLKISELTAEQCKSTKIYTIPVRNASNRSKRNGWSRTSSPASICRFPVRKDILAVKP